MKFYGAELIQCRAALGVTAPGKPVWGQGCGGAAASSGPLLPLLQSEGRGGNRQGGGKRERNNARSTNFNSFPFVGETRRCPDFGNAKCRWHH